MILDIVRIPVWLLILVETEFYFIILHYVYLSLGANCLDLNDFNL